MSGSFKLAVLVYHGIISNDDLLTKVSAGERQYCISDEIFNRQLNNLLNNGFKGISVSEVFGISTGNIVGITFDDGLESDYSIALPELEKRSFLATFYIVTDYVGKRSCMDWGQIKELRRRGMEIGSHSVSHRCLLDLDQKEIVHEMEKSKKILEDRLGEPVESFSVPYGFSNQDIINTALDIGYKTVCTSKTELADSLKVPRIYGRYGIRRGTGIRLFERTVKKRPLTLLKINAIEQGKALFKNVMGRRLWLLFRERLLKLSH